MPCKLQKQIFAALITFMTITAYAQERPLVGAICYPVWSARDNGAIWDEISLTPPKWAHRLPFFADVRNDSSRMIRNSISPEEVVYKLDGDATHFTVYTAFNDSETCSTATDIQLSISTNDTLYTPQLLTSRIIAQTSQWIKVTFFTGFKTEGIRYIKLTIAKTDGSSNNPQIMRVDINYKLNNTDHPSKMVLTDHFTDFSKTFRHSQGLILDTGNVNRYRLVTGMGYSQANVDRQIQYAAAHNIDYFAVLNSYPSSCLQAFVDCLRASPYKKGVKYCLIVFSPGSNETWSAKMARCVEYFNDSNYVKVLGNRPLVYLYDQSKHPIADINKLCSASVASGAGDPYVVGMKSGYSVSFLDAGSSYLTYSVGVTKNYAGTSSTIPFVCFGVNEKPRVDNPPSWGSGSTGFAELTGVKMAPYVIQAMDWCAANRSATPANAILINSWDEFCESAATLCPTRNSLTGLPDTSRITIVGDAIANWKPPNTATELNISPNGVSGLCGLPNPFQNSVQLRYPLLTDRNAVYSIYDSRGRLIRNFDLLHSKGQLTWDGRDGFGMETPSGIYMGRLITRDGKETAHRLMRIR